MRKKITFTASHVFEVDDEDLNEGQDYKSFEEVENCDYDNVGRPLNHLRDLDWEIVETKIEDM